MKKHTEKILFHGPAFMKSLSRPKSWQGNHVNPVGQNWRSLGCQLQGIRPASSSVKFSCLSINTIIVSALFSPHHPHTSQHESNFNKLVR